MLAIPRRDPGTNASAVLAVGVHVLLLAVLFFGIRWRTKHPEPVMAELWSQLPAVEAPLEVIIRTDQSLLLRERVKGQAVDRNVNMAQLVAAVKEKQARSPDQAVVISADKDVRYEAVLKVMDELQRSDVKRVGLMVKPAGRP